MDRKKLWRNFLENIQNDNLYVYRARNKIGKKEVQEPQRKHASWKFLAPMPKLCGKCQKNKAVLKRPKTLEQICRECFFEIFEEEIHQTIVSAKLFKKGEKVAIAASGILIVPELFCKCVKFKSLEICSLPGSKNMQNFSI